MSEESHACLVVCVHLPKEIELLMRDGKKYSAYARVKWVCRCATSVFRWKVAVEGRTNHKAVRTSYGWSQDKNQRIDWQPKMKTSDTASGCYKVVAGNDFLATY